jgi:CcmD family protein
MVVVAYAFIWVGLFVYLWSIWRRLGKVEGEIRTLERRTQGGASR